MPKSIHTSKSYFSTSLAENNHLIQELNTDIRVIGTYLKRIQEGSSPQFDPELKEAFIHQTLSLLSQANGLRDDAPTALKLVSEYPKKKSKSSKRRG